MTRDIERLNNILRVAHSKFFKRLAAGKPKRHKEDSNPTNPPSTNPAPLVHSITSKIKKQRPPDVCAQRMGIEETAAVYFGESISCCAFPRWTVWFTTILAAIGENGCPEDGRDWTIANPDQIIRWVIGNRALVVGNW